MSPYEGKILMALDQLRDEEVIVLDEERRRIWSAIFCWCYAVMSLLSLYSTQAFLSVIEKKMDKIWLNDRVIS